MWLCEWWLVMYVALMQEQVDDGIPLNLCLSRFSHWLQRLAQEKNISYNTAGPADGSRLGLGRVFRVCALVLSDWDLGVCLEFESRRKQLRKLTPLSSWIDLRVTYRKFYSRRPSGLNGALLDLGIAFEGRQHSGLDDARNTAKLAWRMICDGCLMTITKTLTPTPPLCQCGRRCKRNYVQSPGANVGRSFFCCPLGRRSPGNRKSPTGCGFFQWEQAAMKRRHASSPALSTGCTASRSVHGSPSSNLLPQPNFDTPRSKVKVCLNSRDGQLFR
ncbi:hypothetical protein NP493_2015g00013 [Ridgeia piscesae]|uniref:GRF-type domain-containing protein n=1 Tax=Ridgeia piscesae TaxID=27915 RepID=A0AAD9JMI9_RIDPI|nr:hypothetical protein NP493_2015g00013 [Ridgeia piscesae]